MMYIHNINIFNRYLETDRRMFIPYSAGTDIKRRNRNMGRLTDKTAIITGTRQASDKRRHGFSPMKAPA